MNICDSWTPSFLCVANRHCAFMQKKQSDSYLDFLPFIEPSSQCVLRGEFQDTVYKAGEKSIDFLNSLADGIIHDGEVVTPYRTTREKKRMLNEFKYEYDTEVVLGLTRREIGIWIVFAIAYFLRKYLKTCGNRKTMMDFIQPSSHQLGDPNIKMDIASMKPEQLRELRANLLGKSRKQSVK